MSNAFSEIFRPKRPEQLIGESQRNIAKQLLERAAKGDVIQELLFSGDSGIGKTTIAKMYLTAVLGYEYDGQPYNCGDKTGVQYVRDEVIGTMAYLPLDSKYRVYFLDEIHMLSNEAQNSLLVAIEPVPAHVLFVTCTTQPNKLIDTLRSRLTEFRLTPPTIAEFQKLAGWISIKEQKKVPNELRDQAIGLANGNVRQFVRFYQQCLDGTFTGQEEENEPGGNIIKVILSNNRSLTAWFNAVDDSTDYVKQAAGLVGYAIAMISKGSVPKPAMAILEHFGNQPTRTIDSKYTFYHRLYMVYKELYG